MKEGGLGERQKAGGKEEGDRDRELKSGGGETQKRSSEQDSVY